RPVPEPLTVGEAEAEAAVRAGAAEIRAPVVVVQARAIGREVLGIQHVGDVVAEWTVARDPKRRRVHRLVRYAAQDAEHTRRGRDLLDAAQREHCAHGRLTFVRDNLRRRIELRVQPPSVERRQLAWLEDARSWEVIEVARLVPDVAILTTHRADNHL